MSNLREIKQIIAEMISSLPNSDIEKLASQFERQKDDAVPLLLNALDDRNLEVRENAAKILSLIGGNEITPFLQSYYASKNLAKKIQEDKQNKDKEVRKIKYHEQEYRELFELIERLMDFKRWGFQQTFIHPNGASIIYDSEWCRVRFNHGGRDMYGRWDELRIDYGRLHAPNEGWEMIQDDEKCECWHSVYYFVIDFLDGLPPQETVRQFNEGQNARIMQQFKESELGKNLRGINPAEYTVGLHNWLWESFGQRMFEVFDLRRPDLWDAYKLFLKEIQMIQDEDSRKQEKKPLSAITGPLDRIC